MASEVVIAAPRAGTGEWVAEAAFVVFLLLIFVTLEPFAPRFPEVLAISESGVTGKGDILRQISYLGVFAVLGVCAVNKYGIELLGLIPLSIAAVLAWCVLSSMWAPDAGVTFRRAGLEVVVVVTAMLGVETVGIERSLRLLRGVLIAILIVNWLSVPLWGTRAIHQPGEPDASIVGAWRGLYYHKNIAGSICALSTLVFLFFAVNQRSRIDWFLCLAVLAFLAGTESKSSMGLLLPAALGGWIYRVAWKRSLDRSIAVVSVLFALVVGTTAVLMYWDEIQRIVSDPQEFTGRTAIWAAEIGYIADHLALGAGYGSFTNTGTVSPLHNYVTGAWIEAIAHGHNGYLQLMVEIGLIGFVLAMIALIVEPLIALWRRDAVPVPFKAFLFSIFIFVILHNLTESDFLAGEGPTWVIFLFMIAWLRQARAVSVPQQEAVPCPA